MREFTKCYSCGCRNPPKYYLSIKTAPNRYEKLPICFEHFINNVTDEINSYSDIIYHIIKDKYGEPCDIKCKICENNQRIKREKMQLYEYHCEICGNSFSEFDKIYIKDREVECKKCKNENRDKPVILRPVNIIFDKNKS